MARVALKDDTDLSAEFREVFERIRSRGGKVLNLYRAVAHAPEIGAQFLNLGNAILFRGTIPPNLRELAILRVGILNEAPYERYQHVRIAQRVGVPQSQIDALSQWEQSSVFNNEEKAVLRFTDEETISAKVSDDTFNRVKELLGEEGVVELTITVGYYGLVCRVLNILEIELESK